MKNGELDGHDVTGHLDTHTIAHRVLRIIEAIHENENIDRGTLYTEFGKAYFIDKTLNDDDFIPAVLTRLNIDASYIDRADDTSLDDRLQRHIDDATNIVGVEVGVPLIIFENSNGEKQGYFGPVLQGLPDIEEGLELWDGLRRLGTNTHFFELKRSRTGRSHVKTTTRVFDDLA